MDEVSEIGACVTSLVNDWWKDKSSAFLLSALGPILKKNFPDYDIKANGGLQNLCDGIATIRVVRHPEIVQKIGAIPADVRLPDDIRLVFASKVEEGAGPVYSDDFWRAFTRRDEGQRFVNIYSNNTFEISEVGKTGAKGVYEILQADFPSVTPLMPIHEKVEATHEKIKQWLDRNKLNDLVHIFQKGVKSLSGSDGRSSLTDLIKVLSRLADDDLRRINLPADVIVKLHGTR